MPPASTTATKEQLIAILVRALTPYVGGAMAGASARGLCERFGADRPRLDKATIDAILLELEPGLHVYIGREKTRFVMRGISTALEELGGAS